MARTKTQSDEEILAIARTVFVRDGQGASTRLIAKEAGVSEAVLYQRFGTKEGLFFLAMVPSAADLGALVDSDINDAEAYLLDVGERLVAHFVDILPILLRAVTHPGMDSARMHDWHRRLPFPKIVQALASRLAGFRANAEIGPIDPVAAAQAFVASMLSTALFETLTDVLPRAQRLQRIETLIDIHWMGFKP